MPGKSFIFTLSTGRSGTNYLTDLLAAHLTDGEAHHEQAEAQDWGRNSPSVAELTSFNQLGNTPMVRDFWQQKLERVAKAPGRWFAETSHTLVKAGLADNLDLLAGHGVIHLVELQRDVTETVISMTQRADFSTRGNLWLWYLDPDYPNVIVPGAPFKRFGQAGLALWYVIEMRTRAAYYRHLLADHAHIRFHQVDMRDIVGTTGALQLMNALGLPVGQHNLHLPGKVNANQDAPLDAASRTYIQDLVAACPFDAEAIARDWYRSGKRLAAPASPRTN